MKIKFALFRGGVGRGAGRKIVQNAIFRGKRHDNKILKVKFVLSRNFVVMAQAPNLVLEDPAVSQTKVCLVVSFPRVETPLACYRIGFGPPARNRGKNRKNIGNDLPQKIGKRNKN